MTELCFTTACELARMIRDKEVSCREVMQAHLDQIDRVNQNVNAIVVYLPERGLDGADAADKLIAQGEELGPLFGLPVAHKDLVPTKGITTTWGSPIYKGHVPNQDGLIVTRLRGAGAITIGKTNTPEFGAGSQTFNPVYGATLNPYNAGKTCGGSSGGAAVSLACGMLPIADGSDTGGSLRNPANFCNIVGFRPSPGRVPVWPADVTWSPTSVQGPMARTVEDVALMLSAIAGPDVRWPISIAQSGDRFRQPLDRDFKDVKIAWSRDFGDLPVEPDVTETIDAQRSKFEDIGCIVEDATPDFRDADAIFKTWRAWQFEIKYSPMLEKYRDQIKATVVWNTEEGQKLTGPDIGRAEVMRTKLYHRMCEFLDKYEFLIVPVNQVPPFDVDVPYIEEINGTKMETYIDWMKSCYYITVTGLPAISVPCGFTKDGLPVGVQIVGRHQADFEVLQLAYAFQQATQFWKQRPPVA